MVVDGFTILGMAFKSTAHAAPEGVVLRAIHLVRPVQ